MTNTEQQAREQSEIDAIVSRVMQGFRADVKNIMLAMEMLDTECAKEQDEIDLTSDDSPTIVTEEAALRAITKALDRTHSPDLDDQALEPIRLAYKTGYDEGYSDGSGKGWVDRDACEEGWQQYLEALSTIQPPAIEDWRAGAFITAVSEGGEKPEYYIKLAFPTLEAMQAAHRALLS